MGTVYIVPFVEGGVDITGGQGSGTAEATAFRNRVLVEGLRVYDLTQAGYNGNVVYYSCDSDQQGRIAATSTGFYRYGSGRVTQIYNNNSTVSSYRFSSANPEWINLSPVQGIDTFSTKQEAYDAIIGAQKVTITYRNINCSAPSAPVSAYVGDTVTVQYTFPEGYGIVNPSSDIYVTNNGVVVPSTYSNGVLTFTMPDPSQ